MEPPNDDEPEWKAPSGVWFDGHVYRALLADGELVLRRTRGVLRRDVILKWPVRALSNVDFEQQGVAYKDGAFVPVERGALEFQVGRGLVRLEGQPDELRQAYELIRRASKADPRQAARQQEKAEKADPEPGPKPE